MPQAVVDPEELRRFARNLKQFNDGLEEQMARLHAQFTALGATWRDQEQDKFAEEFEQALAVIRRFCQASSQQIPFLLRKAQRVEEYLDQR